MIQPGTKVTITIEAAVYAESGRGALHVTYGEDGEHTMIVTPDDLLNGVTITEAR